MIISIAIATNGTRLTIDADPGILGSEILEQLIEANVLPSPKAGSHYSFQWMGSERERETPFDLERSLLDNGAEDYDVLVLLRTDSQVTI